MTWRIAISVLNKDKSAVPPPFYGPERFSSESDKAKFFAENLILRTQILMTVVSLWLLSFLELISKFTRFL